MHTGPEVVKKLIGKIKGLKIVSKDLGRSFEENMGEKNYDFLLSGSYAPKG